MKLEIGFQLIKVLYDTSIITAEALATRVGISTRSVHRYLDELTVSGIPVQTKRGRYHGGIYLPKAYKKRMNTFLVGGAICRPRQNQANRK